MSDTTTHPSKENYMFAFNNAWPQFTFEFNPSQRDAPAGSLLIGLGDGNDTESQKGVALNNKGYRAGHYNSVSELVANADDRQWTIWRNKLSSVGEYNESLSKISLWIPVLRCCCF